MLPNFKDMVDYKEVDPNYYLSINRIPALMLAYQVEDLSVDDISINIDHNFKSLIFRGKNSEKKIYFKEIKSFTFGG